jgi:hypothetical protein
LQLLQVKDQLEVICTRHSLYRERSVSFERLVDAAESSASTPQLYLYNQDTCTEFHDLLISLLVGHAKALRELHELCSTPKHLTISAIHTVWFISHLLWEVTESAAYRMHLDTIQHHVPTISYSWLHDYEEFSRCVGLAFHDATGMRQNIRDVLLCDVIPEQDAMDAKQDAVDAELTPPRLTCKAIISRQVAYPAAITLLLKYCTALVDHDEEFCTTPFSGHLLAVQQSEESISWPGIESALSNLHLERELEVMSIIQ